MRNLIAELDEEWRVAHPEVGAQQPDAVSGLGAATSRRMFGVLGGQAAPPFRRSDRERPKIKPDRSPAEILAAVRAQKSD